MTVCTDLWQDLLADANKPPLSVTIAPLREDPTLIFRPLSIAADTWQRDVLKSTADKILLLCSRQSGKSQTMAAMALVEALTHDYAEVLILSRTLRQALELMRKVKELWRGIKGEKVNKGGHRRFRPDSLKPESDRLSGIIEAKGWDGAAFMIEDPAFKVKDLALSWTCPANGSRITALPGSTDNIVGYSSVTLIIIDEASRVPDSLYQSVRPMQAVTYDRHGRPGRMVVASTPFGKRGWFYEAWQNCEKYEAAFALGSADRLAEQGMDSDQRQQGNIQGRGIHVQGGAERYTSDAHRRGSVERDVGVREDGLVEAARIYSGDDGWLRTPYVAGWEGKAPTPPFQTFRVTADQCPRITKQFLEDERAQLGVRWASQEYDCAFVDTIDNVFSSELISGMFTAEGSGPLELWIDG